MTPDSRARSIKTRIETIVADASPGFVSDSRARSIKTRIETEVWEEAYKRAEIREQDPLKQGLKHIIFKK
ncbi:hypothetical protein MSMAP_0717 [Methanosarcina mazei SarPi]|uniref:Uncharacterized protein n=1 Tax=Methanosarcina mazei SarPi TaxID=1434115 RepID=A0A0E3R6W6_METMZ|nr:hypothetical protein MSMAP_0717 [Methanosarcina mazei SarPi]